MIGSPRKGSNTDILVDQLLKGAEESGHVSQKLYLYEYDIKPCVDCRKCKTGEPVCALKDDMRDIYPLLDQADILVFGTPNYWFGPSAKMKLLIDRLRPYVSSRILEGKFAAGVVPAAGGPSVCGPMIESFKMSFDYLGMKYAGSILGEAFERKEILEKPDSLREAYEFGKNL